MPPQVTIRKKPVLILDTNIIIYSVQSWMKEQLTKERLKQTSQYTLTISKITRYEILKNAQVRKGSTSLDLLNTFESFHVTEKVLIIAGLLYRIYKENQERIIQDPDLIIASTAFLNNSSIFTANKTDFPYPYFEEQEITPVLYKRDANKTDCLLLAVVKPNSKLIKSEIDKILS